MYNGYITPFKFDSCKICSKANSGSGDCKNCNGHINVDELYEADPDCEHDITDASGGGIVCTKCGGWFCY